MTHNIVIPAENIPAGTRWDVPQQNAGQIVEVAYGGSARARYQHDSDAVYKRITDKSIPVGDPERVTYYASRTVPARWYDLITDRIGPVCEDFIAARASATRHAASITKQGGFTRLVIVTETDTGRCQEEDGSTCWPSHGKSMGAARWTTP